MADERKNSLGGLRSAALVAVVFGAIGSIGLLRHAQEHPPPLIVVLFVVWVFAPFGLLGAANIFSNNWPATIRVTLYVVTLFVAAASLAVYLDDSIAHRTAKRAVVYVLVPPASGIVSAVALGIAALRGKKTSPGQG
jgi:multisubunit Na+/H+ antiporter MnhG subunit